MDIKNIIANIEALVNKNGGDIGTKGKLDTEKEISIFVKMYTDGVISQKEVDSVIEDNTNNIGVIQLIKTRINASKIGKSTAFDLIGYTADYEFNSVYNNTLQNINKNNVLDYLKSYEHNRWDAADTSSGWTNLGFLNNVVSDHYFLQLYTEDTESSDNKRKDEVIRHVAQSLSEKLNDLGRNDDVSKIQQILAKSSFEKQDMKILDNIVQSIN